MDLYVAEADRPSHRRALQAAGASDRIARSASPSICCASDPSTRGGFADALVAMREHVVLCSVCQNITDQRSATICRNPSRDKSLMCLVEEPLDILAIERTGEYHGV